MPEVAVAGRGRDDPRARAGRGGLRRLELGGAAPRGQGAVKLDGEPAWRPWTSPRTRWTGGFCRSASGALPASPSTPDATGEIPAGPGPPDGYSVPPRGPSRARPGGLYSPVRSDPRWIRVLRPPETPDARRARRSLKTQQRVHSRPQMAEECVQVRPRSSSLAMAGARLSRKLVVPRLRPVTASVYGDTNPNGPGLIRPALRGRMTLSDDEVLHGEFDPGSGRTLAACLTHASGATNQGLAPGAEPRTGE